MSIAVTSVPPSVLCFGPADPTAGAGIQSDVLTVASLGCHPLTVMCAVVPRDTRGMDDFVPLDPDLLVAQARAVLEDIPVSAFKLGSAGSAENVAAIAEILSDYPDVPLVLEPALHHLDGDDEGGDEYIAALIELILPQTTILVIGMRELLRLADFLGDSDGGEDFSHAEAVERVLASGLEYLLVTGAGEPGPKLVNILYAERGTVRSDTWERLEGHYLGARATLSGAVAAALAQGMEVPEAVREAQEFTWEALASAYRPGMGLGLPDRLFWVRNGDTEDE